MEKANKRNSKLLYDEDAIRVYIKKLCIQWGLIT